MIERVFWGWDKPVVDLAVGALTRDWQGGEFDLGATLIIVPTSEAARRLKEALARAAAKRGAAVSVPHVWAPERALLTDEDRALAASDTQLLLSWTRTLLQAEPGDFSALFPILPAERSWAWAVEMARALISVSTALGAGGWSFADVAKHEGLPHDRERWRDLARLEEACASVLGELGVQDAQALKKQRADVPQLPEGVKRIVVMPSPDLPRLFRRWLAAISAQVPVTIHVHAPASLAACFDDCGAPLQTQWGEKSELCIPLNNKQLHLEHDPSEQARRLMDLLREHVPEQRTAIGVCDAEVSAHLEDRLRQESVRVYEPGGRPAERHGTVQMLDRWVSLAASDDWADFAALLRMPDVRDGLTGASGAGGTRVLDASDDFAAQHLPVTLAHGLELIERFILSKGDHADDASKLGIAMHSAHSLIDAFQRQPLHEAARGLLMKLFGERSYEADSPQQRAQVDLCSDWLVRCEELHTQAEALGLKAASQSLLALSIDWLKQQSLSDPRGEIDLVLTGWLELLWEPSPVLLVAGFNEESVPGILISHPFLPDQLRESLGLACQSSRFARDAYMLRALAGQRQESGALHLSCGLWSEGKDALRPSRLLFLCEDAQLVQRVRHLFPKDFETTLPKEPARQRAWKLRPRVGTLKTVPLTTISVSRLRSYLACPFRYYLDNVLHMSSVEAAPVELDAMAYGNLIHGALQALQSEEGKRCGSDAAALEQLLCARAEAIAHVRHGRRLPVPVQLQLDGALQRLRAAAKIEADIRVGGWRTEASELRIGYEDDDGLPLILAGARWHGIIDRIDTNDGGLCRIIDYKSSDKPDAPILSHLKVVKKPDTIEADESWKTFAHTASGVTYRWIDLQLPLYAKAWGLRTGAAISAAYFNLPKAVEHTSLNEFVELDDEMIDAAVKVAEEAVRRINLGIFWPPAGTIRPEDYPGLICGEIEDAVEWPSDERTAAA